MRRVPSLHMLCWFDSRAWFHRWVRLCFTPFNMQMYLWMHVLDVAVVGLSWSAVDVLFLSCSLEGLTKGCAMVVGHPQWPGRTLLPVMTSPLLPPMCIVGCRRSTHAWQLPSFCMCTFQLCPILQPMVGPPQWWSEQGLKQSYWLNWPSSTPDPRTSCCWVSTVNPTNFCLVSLSTVLVPVNWADPRDLQDWGTLYMETILMINVAFQSLC